MLAELLGGLVNGIGFMLGVLTVYTVYDGIFTLVEKHQAKAASNKRKKRRR